MSVKITRDRMPDVLKAVRDLTAREVLVGVPGTTTDRNGAEPVTNADLGYIHEFGSPAANIPARPFLVPGIRAAGDKIASRLEVAAMKALDGDPSEADAALHRAGLVAQNSARATINAGVPPPLAPATLAGRRARGRTGEKPLIDTGQLRSSITYVIRPKG